MKCLQDCFFGDFIPNYQSKSKNCKGIATKI